ncbi:MAG TPA: hypothetical protein PKD86_18430, partial [Gemmatales bacterium]|nr:hypothetical protein [Gemmatales bacterium]
GWSGFIAWHSLHVATIFFGALVAGSGQPLWLFYGSALGFISAMLSLILTLGKHTMVPDMMLLGVIMLEMGAAVFGAWLGAFIWKPLTAVKVDQPVDRRQAAAAARRMAPYKEFALSFNFLSFRLNWGRILIGTIVAAVGYTFARQIFDAVVNQFRLGGALDHAPEVRVNVLRDLIGGVSVMLGGMIAGSSSKAGPAHGIWLALLSCGFVVVHNYLLRDVPLRTDELSPHLMLVAFLCLLGGFLGSRLMPPIAKVQPGKAPARRNVEI